MSQLDEIRARIPNIPESDMSRHEKDRAYLISTIDRVESLCAKEKKRRVAKAYITVDEIRDALADL